MGSLHIIDFGVFWASWGGSGKDPGFDRFCGSKVPVQKVSKVSVFDGFRGVRFCSRGFDGTVSGNRVPGTRGNY